MLNTPFSTWPSFTDEEADAVRRVILSNRVNYWTGMEGRDFEREFAAWCGSRYAVALSNGTVALDVALHALGITQGDEVIVTPRSFIASASCVVNVGAKPVFADVDECSGNITAATIEPCITSRTKAVICVHLAGWPCDMDPIMALAKRYDLQVIEDCAQAHGARYKGRSVGTIGNVGAWSFCQDKIMTTGGEGGMVTTDDEHLWEKMWSFKDHGKNHTAVYEHERKPGFRWLHDSIGTNWRMLEVQAAIGRIQLRRMDSWMALRRRNAEFIWGACRPHSAVRVPNFLCDSLACAPECAKRRKCVHAHYKCYVYVNEQGLARGWDRDRIMAAINARGVPCYHGTCSEIYLEKAFVDLRLGPVQRLPTARQLGETSLMFLVHPTLTSDEMAWTCDVVSGVLAESSVNSSCTHSQFG